MATIPDAELPPPIIGTGAYARELTSFALPLRRTDAHTWDRVNGARTYTVTAATVYEDKKSYAELPSGKYARAALFYLFSQARLTDEEVISLGRTPSDYLKFVGISKGGVTQKEALRQLQLVARAQFTIRAEDLVETPKGSAEVEDIRGGVLSEGVRLWTPLSGEHAGETMTSEVKLSSYFKQMVPSAVPIPRKAWHQLMRESKSAMSLDIYVWLCARLYSVNGKARMSWEQLHQQFGSTTDIRDFKRIFRQGLELALQVYPGARVEEAQSKTQRRGFNGLILSEGSPLPVESLF